MHNFEDMLTFIALANFFPLIIIIILMHVHFLSLMQVEHLKVSLGDLLRRYNPPVEKSQYKVSLLIILQYSEIHL